jgi:alkanesulfonate monooxygenase SsuD/methylene tetrahydromethanopterin reductase-like flavin-dependent oxidoreductase (luciferase family)
MTRIGVALGSGMSPPDIVDCVKLAEELGYESAWIIEGLGTGFITWRLLCLYQNRPVRDYSWPR